jgi:hypothetical protein
MHRFFVILTYPYADGGKKLFSAFVPSPQNPRFYATAFGAALPSGHFL